VRQAKRCFALGTRLRGCDKYLVLKGFRPSEKKSFRRPFHADIGGLLKYDLQCAVGFWFDIKYYFYAK
jgi:hypothetical protein